METKTYIIISVCSICNITYDVKDGKGKSGISHGYCPDCFEKEMRKMNDEFPQ